MFPDSQVKSDSFFANIAVEDGDCDDTFAYAGDLGAPGLVVLFMETPKLLEGSTSLFPSGSTLWKVHNQWNQLSMGRWSFWFGDFQTTAGWIRKFILPSIQFNHGVFRFYKSTEKPNPR